MKTSSVSLPAIPSNIISICPTIRKLADLIVQTMNLTNEDAAIPQQCDEMRELVRQYSSDFPIHSGSSANHGESVLLTESTGALGSSRPSPLHVRLESSFLERGLDVGILKSPKLVLVEGDLSQENLGLEANIFGDMKRDVTSIIHKHPQWSVIFVACYFELIIVDYLAWATNFRLPLRSVEPMLLGTRRLVNFALTSTQKLPPRFLFVSSVGVLATPEERIRYPAVSVGIGYAGYSGSKRVGQLSGGLNGCWNKNEWFPPLVQSSSFLECIPTVKE
ncbi:hypothetical protein C8J56DRAFT_1105574 [Mycena floridula]|nr:hypothetical protein C8J56DRAFT_1105574 [Mycena floridula]